jgi:sortase A
MHRNQNVSKTGGPAWYNSLIERQSHIKEVMIRVGIKRRKQLAPAPGVSQVEQIAADPQYILASQATSLSKRAKPVRLLGNLLILAGLLMLLGIGGWYGYTQWDNQRQLDEIAQKFPESVKAPVADGAAVIRTPEPTATPFRVLAGVATPSIPQWQTVLKVEDTSPAVRLVIPSVKIDSKVVPVNWKMIPGKNGQSKSEWQVADFAVGHHYGSANPGQQGNVVLSGHVDYKGEVFKNLHNVNKGDEVTVYTEKGQYIYVVTDLVIVKEEGVSDAQKRANAAYMNPTPDQTLTMITCFPYGIDDHRLIVIAKPYQSPASTQSEFLLR